MNATSSNVAYLFRAICMAAIIAALVILYCIRYTKDLYEHLDRNYFR